MPKKVSVVVPVYFNDQSLNILFDQLAKVEHSLKSLDLDFEVIAIDDGSKDTSAQVLDLNSKKHSFLKSYSLTKNFGESTASKFGLSKISGDAFVVLAADLQDPPELIIDMAKKWLSGSKFIVCEREKRTDPLATKLLANIYYKFLTKFIMPNYPKRGFGR